jgi:hypothetical protein
MSEQENERIRLDDEQADVEGHVRRGYNETEGEDDTPDVEGHFRGISEAGRVFEVKKDADKS